MKNNSLTRRAACERILTGTAVVALGSRWKTAVAADESFKLSYLLGSCMYGTTALAEILPEVKKSGAEHVDIWPRRHGNQREQIEQMGHDAFGALLEKHDVKLGMLTRYDLGPFKLQTEMKFAHRFGARIIITGSGGPKGLAGAELKAAMKTFIEKMKPHAAVAGEQGVLIGIENHGNALLDSLDSIRYLAELSEGLPIGVAMAPYHLPQETATLARLIEDIGPKLIHFYAWEHGMGCFKKLPKEQEMLQLPGYGNLDFTPILAAMKKIDYRGWTEVFMHPVPRGIPILEPTTKVTDAINKSRAYLDNCAKNV